MYSVLWHKEILPLDGHLGLRYKHNAVAIDMLYTNRYSVGLL